MKFQTPLFHQKAKPHQFLQLRWPLRLIQTYLHTYLLSYPIQCFASYLRLIQTHLLTYLLRCVIKIKTLLRVKFLLTLGGGGEEQEALALLRKKGGREGSMESQQKFDIIDILL